MKKSWLILVISILIMQMVSAQSVPEDIESTTIQAIAQEHKNTRKFVSDEITRQRNEFFTEMETQAQQYERKANDIVDNAVWKLGLMWGGVVFFITGILGFIRRRLDKRKWNKMLESAKAEIKADLNQEKEKIDKQHQDKHKQLLAREMDLSMKEQYIDKARPQLMEMQKRMQKQQAELSKVMQDLDLRG